MTNKKSFLLACSLALMISLNSCMFLKHDDTEKIALDVECPTPVKEIVDKIEPTLQATNVDKKVLTAHTNLPKSNEKKLKQVITEKPEETQKTQEATSSSANIVCATSVAKGDNAYKNSLKDLQATLEQQISDLNQKQKEAENNVKDTQSKETGKMINNVMQKEAEVMGTCAPVMPATPEATEELAPEATEELTPEATEEPTPEATPYQTIPVLTKKTLKAADDHAAESDIDCEVNTQNLIQFKNSGPIEDFGKVLDLKVGPPTIATSVSETTSNAKGVAADNSTANTVQSVKSTTTADAEGDKNSIAVSAVVGNTEANSNNLAVDNAKSVNVVDNVNNATATAEASENSLAVSGVKSDQKSDTNTVAADNSTAVGGTQMTTNTESNADAVEGSVADSKAIASDESTTNTAAGANSTAIGVTAVTSDTKSNADAANQSLAQSVAETDNKAKTDTVALDNSAAVGASIVDSTSNSNAISTDGGNALSTSNSKSNVNTESAAKDNSASVVVNTGGSQSNATSVSNGTAAPYENPLLQGTADSSCTPVLESGRPGVNGDQIKIPCILDTTSKVTLKSGDGSNLRDQIIAEKDSCGTLEDHRDDILRAADDCGIEEAEQRRLRQAGDRDSECYDRRERRSPKFRGSNDRLNGQYDMCAPGYECEPGRYYGDDCELNQKVKKNFRDSYREETRPDARFSENNMFTDRIKEYDARNNDERVNDDCTDICRKEGLGRFISSEIQDIMRGNFLFKCTCDQGITDWYMYDSRTDKSRSLSSTARQLLDHDDQENCYDIPYPERPTMDINATNKIPNLQSSNDCYDEAPTRPVLSAPQYDSDECDQEDECDDVSKCGNFVSRRIDAARRHAKGGADDKMHSDLGECFNKFIENKFNKLHSRLNKIKNKNTNYVKDIHKKQLKKQAAKVNNIVSRRVDNVEEPDFGGARSCEPSRGGDNLRNIQSNLNELKRDLKLNSSAKKCTPEDIYFKQRNDRDQARFDERLKNRFDVNCEDNRFASRFGNIDRYNTRDGGSLSGAKKAASLKGDSNAFISDQVGRIKDQNKEYLSKIKNMFGGCE